jgi:glycyl-tRNA synthetase beta chain
MVGEFPDLQGVMGREYARRDGEPEAVARAIEEHYRPRFAGGPLPESAPGALLAVAEKLDTLTGCFKAGLVPTATQDPYGLRRAALGVIAILGNRPDWSVPLDMAIWKAFKLHAEPEKSGIPDLLKHFFRGRLQRHLVAEGHAHDVVDAVLSARLDKKRVEYLPGDEGRVSMGSFSWDIAGIRARVELLTEEKRSEDFLPLATTFRRVVNIIPPAWTGHWEAGPGLTAPAEKGLADAYVNAKSRIEQLVPAKQYREVFQTLRSLKAPVDVFFEEIMVMDKEHPDLMKQRLTLLQKIADLFFEIADFSKIVVEPENQH